MKPEPSLRKLYDVKIKFSLVSCSLSKQQHTFQLGCNLARCKDFISPFEYPKKMETWHLSAAWISTHPFQQLG